MGSHKCQRIWRESLSLRQRLPCYTGSHEEVDQHQLTTSWKRRVVQPQPRGRGDATVRCDAATCMRCVKLRRAERTASVSFTPTPSQFPPNSEAVDRMATQVPASLKPAGIARFAQRAAQLEQAKPVIAYWCRDLERVSNVQKLTTVRQLLDCTANSSERAA